MRNTHPGTCYRCGKGVREGEGHFERHGRSWRTQHADCAIKYRGTSVHFLDNPDTQREKSDAAGKRGVPPYRLLHG